jgi:hypothetical protein
MFLQISNSSAFLIFNARTTGFFFMSKPALELFLSAVVSQVRPPLLPLHLLPLHLLPSPSLLLSPVRVPSPPSSRRSSSTPSSSRRAASSLPSSTRPTSSASGCTISRGSSSLISSRSRSTSSRTTRPSRWRPSRATRSAARPAGAPPRPVPRASPRVTHARRSNLLPTTRPTTPRPTTPRPTSTFAHHPLEPHPWNHHHLSHHLSSLSPPPRPPSSPPPHLSSLSPPPEHALYGRRPLDLQGRACLALGRSHDAARCHALGARRRRRQGVRLVRRQKETEKHGRGLRSGLGVRGGDAATHPPHAERTRVSRLRTRRDGDAAAVATAAGTGCV